MHIAVVDPSRTVLKCVSLLLKARDHHVYPFTDGNEALRYIDSDPQIDAAIISAEQTCGSGVELCWQTRLLASSYRPIYVILMSSHDGNRTLVEGLDSGADDFISKPPVADELYARLRAAERVNTMQRDLIRLATTDSLTGVLNRRAFFARSESVCERADAGVPITAVMLDIDHFKQVNDRYGHGVGDEVIRRVAAAAAAGERVVGRLGGEEFAIVLEADIAEASRGAEALRAEIATFSFDTEQGPMSCTCSFGTSQWRRGDNLDELLRRADMALYAAKTGGRNRVVADHPGLPLNDYHEHHRTVIRGSPRTAPDVPHAIIGATPLKEDA
jgi:two-component system, cell cycle response regulator